MKNKEYFDLLLKWAQESYETGLKMKHTAKHELVMRYASSGNQWNPPTHSCEEFGCKEIEFKQKSERRKWAEENHEKIKIDFKYTKDKYRAAKLFIKAWEEKEKPIKLKPLNGKPRNGIALDMERGITFIYQTAGDYDNLKKECA